MLLEALPSGGKDIVHFGHKVVSLSQKSGPKQVKVKVCKTVPPHPVNFSEHWFSSPSTVKHSAATQLVASTADLDAVDTSLN